MRRDYFLAETHFPATVDVQERARQETLGLSCNVELANQRKAALRKCYDAPFSEQLASLYSVTEAGRDARLRGQIRWDMWHRNLLGRPWHAYDHALDYYGHAFGPSVEDDFHEDSNANATSEWQPVRGIA